MSEKNVSVKILPGDTPPDFVPVAIHMEIMGKVEDAPDAAPVFSIGNLNDPGDSQEFVHPDQLAFWRKACADYQRAQEEMRKQVEPKKLF